MATNSPDAAYEPRIGLRVRLVGSHAHRGERGVITNTPGKVFYGWAVKLDSGIVVGASTQQLDYAKGDHADA